MGKLGLFVSDANTALAFHIFTSPFTFKQVIEKTWLGDWRKCTDLAQLYARSSAPPQLCGKAC